MRNKILPGFLLVIVLFTACTKEEEPAPNNNNNNNNDPVEMCDTLNATYNSNVAVILNTNCAVSGCHTGPAPANGINLSTYSNAKAVASTPAFLGAINHEDGYVPMPFQKPKLDQGLIDVLTCWVQNGFPEN